MRIGLLYDLANPPEWAREPTELYRHEIEQAVRAEQLGLDGIWVTEHHFTHGYINSPLVFLAAVAARTRSVRLGTAVLLPHLYHPVRLAEEVAIVDILSGGRIELGVGIGTTFQEYQWFGVNPKERISRVREILDILRLAWSGQEFSYEGRHYRLGPLTVIPRPVQDPHPPLLGGAISLEGARRVGRWGLPLQWIDRDIAEAYLSSFSDAGHDPAQARIDGYLNLFVCDDPAALWPSVRELYRYQFSRNVLYGLKAVDPGGNVREVPLPTGDNIEAMRGQAFLLVTPDQAIEEIDRRTKGLPVSGLICHNRIPGMPDEVSERHVELLATVVKPAVESFGVPA